MSHVQSMSLSEQESSKNESSANSSEPTTGGESCCNKRPCHTQEKEALPEAFSMEGQCCMHDSKPGEEIEETEQCCMHEMTHEDHIAEPHADSQEPSANVAKDSSHKQAYDLFLKDLESQPDAEAKLQLAVNFMENTLSKQGTPHFKSFWEARNVALLLFKENISPNLRSEMWTKYTDLSKEARRLKDILDEQSAFAAEQIEIAIQALENEIENSKELQQKAVIEDFLQGSETLASKKDYYYNVQKELNVLNAHASRINALRKELVRTEMRIRQKNKFFQRLSAAGDKVFPLRKDLIKQISQYFIEDVDAFIEHNFKSEDIQDSLFFLREEIKAFQSAAKVITLNTHSFTHTRMRLSECWDKIKHLEKERKKVRAQQKAVHKQNAQYIKTKFAEISEAIKAGEVSSVEIQRRLDEVSNEMRNVDLGKEEVKELRDELSAIRKPLLDKAKSEEHERQSQVQEREKQKRQKVDDVRQSIEALVKGSDEFDGETLNAKKEELQSGINDLPITKTEKQELERLLKPLKDVIADKKEKALMSLSDDDRQAMQQLKDILQQRKERRQEIKNQIEHFRKLSGASGLGFTAAMSYNEQVAAEKDRLEKANQGIREIEQKIAELQNKI